jgi:hypothetical protein
MKSNFKAGDRVFYDSDLGKEYGTIIKKHENMEYSWWVDWDNDEMLWVEEDHITLVKHIHAEVIIAWANGAKIEYYNEHSDKWKTTDSPMWNTDTKYRVSKKEDYILTFGLDKDFVNYGAVKVTFDGETNKPKSVELTDE